MRRRAGFTLLEMLVATLIMGIAIVGTLAAITGSMRNASKLMARDRAVQLARSKMGELLLDKKLPRGQVITGEFEPLQTGGEKAGWRARVAVFDKPERPFPGVLALDRIELEVWWMAGEDRRSFTLEAFRSRTLTGADLPRPEAVP